MATSNRLRGNANPIFTLRPVGGTDPADSYSDDLKSTELKWDDKDDSDITFWEASQGELQDATLTTKFVLSWDAGSLCAYAWAVAGQDLEVVWGPWGNAVPSATKPHFTGTAAFTGKPPLANEAKKASDTSGAEVELDLKFSTGVTPVTA